ncbi:MAG: fibronectin type III domain-containing protein [Archangium sp.]|nr:fibronectin type III domain-containing protein [Archangium sp.]
MALLLGACGGMQTNPDAGTQGGGTSGVGGGSSAIAGGRTGFDAGAGGGSAGGVGGGSGGGGDAGGSAGGSGAGGSAGGDAGGSVGGGSVGGGSVGGGSVGGGSVGGGSVGGGGAPPTPTGFAATVESSTSVRLTWASATVPPSIYELERGSTASGPFSLVVQAAGSAVTHLDTGLTSGTTVWYRLRAVTNGTPSAWTTPVSATPVILNGPPDAPTMPAVGSPTENSLTITWADSSTNETGFEVQRAPVAQGPFFTFVTRPPGSTSVVDTGLAPGTPFHYRIRAINALGASPYTLTVAGITLPPNVPTMPAAVQEVINNAGVVRFTWSDQSQAEGRYEIMR